MHSAYSILDQQGVALPSDLMTAINKLAPYVAPAMEKHHIDPYQGLVEVGEPYLALDWLLGSATLPEVSIPSDVLDYALDCLNEEDREEYAQLLQHVSTS